MATAQAIETPTVLHLPITGKRGRRRVVVGWFRVPNDAFSRRELLPHSWQRHSQGYVFRNGVRDKSNNNKRPTIYAHLVVAAHHLGPVPVDREVDHIDRDKTNCLPSNLRVVTHGLNITNRGMLRNNTSGYNGVYLHKTRKGGRVVSTAWCAHVRKNGVRERLGSYPTAEAAAAAVNAAYRRLHPEAPIPNPQVT